MGLRKNIPKNYEDGFEIQGAFALKKTKSFKLEELVEKNNDTQLDNFVEAVVEAIKNKMNCSRQELRFYRDCAQLLIGKPKSSNPILIPAKCGLGKSTFILMFLVVLIDFVNKGLIPEMVLPLIIATNKIDDLVTIAAEVKKLYENYYSNVPYVFVMKAWNDRINCPYQVRSYDESLTFCSEYSCDDYASGKCELSEQMRKQKLSPILAITNERLSVILDHANADDGINRYCVFKNRNGEIQNRNMLIIDEQPKFLRNDIIKISDIYNLLAKVNNILADSPSERLEKRMLSVELENIKDIFVSIRKEFTNNKIAFVYPKEKGLTENFKQIWKKHFKIDNIKVINAVNDFLLNGGLFCNRTENDYIITLSKSLFNIGNLKTFVFDGTAYLSQEYNSPSYNFLRLAIDDYKNYHNLTFKLISFNISKSSVCEHPYKLNAAAKWLARILAKPTYVVSYKDCHQGKNVIHVSAKLFDLLKDNPNIIFDTNGDKMIFPYFGGNKGKNTWKDCEQMVQLGWHRYRPEDYIASFISINDHFKEYLINYYENHKFDFEKDFFFCNPDGTFIYKPLESHRIIKMASDEEQEIFRTRVRNFSDTDTPIVVYLFNANGYLMSILEKRFINCNIEKVDVPWEFLSEKNMNRKAYRSKSKSEENTFKKILDYIEIVFSENPNFKFGLAAKTIENECNIKKSDWYHYTHKNIAFMQVLGNMHLKLYQKGNRVYVTRQSNPCD